MKTQRLLALFLSCLVVFQASQAQTKTSAQPAAKPAPSGEETRVARLAGLAKVWGAVKFFHPYLAYREIDWDKALIETLPRVNSARSAEEYQAPVNQMFSVLNDKSTRADFETNKQPDAAVRPTGADEKPVRNDNGVVIINATNIAAAVAKDNSKLNGFVTSVTQALPNSTGIVIDARSTAELADPDLYYFGVFLRQTLVAILDTRVVLGSTRYRMHNGYATQTGSGASR